LWLIVLGMQSGVSGRRVDGDQKILSEVLWRSPRYLVGLFSRSVATSVT
jgi:hypothetical protein